MNALISNYFIYGRVDSMMVSVEKESLVDVVAIDNVINALIARMFIAVQNGNTILASHYQKEIVVNTAERASIISNIRFTEPRFELTVIHS
jgi:hypothetical protein